jgi:ATP:ADP antiporter, AAA family
VAGEAKSPLERALGIVTEVRAGEGGTALLLTLNVFLLLTAYYVIKPVREALILAMPSGAEYKSYMSAAIAVALLFAVPAYARATNRLSRNKLVVGVTLFFVSHLVLFYLASVVESVRPYLGLLFFLWVGIFNMMVVAQFWAFANDIYSEEQGKRLFALLGLGASVGAAVGSKIAAAIVEPIGVFNMLLVAAVMLALCALLSQLAHVRESGREKETPQKADAVKAQPVSKEGAFGLVFKNKYLLLVAFFSLIFSFVNTNGEYMLGRLASEEASRLVAAGQLAADAKGAWIGKFYGEFFFYVNTAGVLLQTFAVSRLVKYGGIRISFFIFPVIALLDAVAVTIMPILAIIRIGKIGENATDYSLNNTLRNMLWLPTTREMKYKAKQAVDTFFVRMGDVGSAGLVLLGSALAWSVRPFAATSALLVVAWLVVAVGIVREYTRLSEERKRAEATKDAPRAA